MKEKFFVALRILFGLMLVTFGLNGFLQFMPMPTPPPEGAAYLGALAGTGYFFPVLKATEVLVGAALLSNRFVALALVVMAPVSIHILLYHIFLDTSGLIMALFVFGANLGLGLCRLSVYRSLLSPKPNI
ncbi:MAG: hypothetical protein H6624_11755 [Bdellovibrionaceae bacterium]|nr:acyltransferase [Bdellovibrionales bacterium]MCB9085015.1 hypothetical protein [Pseudobdellovibrionaceae bacterium]